ncbi:cytochrome P450 [Streptomyces sp. NPDC050315]|uniref:cytochrome P450 family protein n=1 Tax=Streptomyces sp. NPDC050315 TaxID=3155039 RepID=UPI0034302A72
MGQQPVAIDPAGTDLPGEAARLRAIGPAALVELPGGIRAWSIGGHALLKRLLADDRVSKDPRQHWPAWQNGEHHDSWLQSWVGVTNMFTAYGADHRRLRKLVAPAFTGRRTEAMAPRVERITKELLADLDAAPAGEPVDLISSYAHPLPMRMICELFGIPEESRAEVGQVIAEVFDTTATPEQASATAAKITAVLGDLIALKRREPGDDMTSVLVSTRDDDGSRLEERELLDTLLLVIGAGYETTVNLIGNAVHALLTHPEQRALLASGRAGWDDVIEETLRWAPSIANLPLRYAVEDIPLADGTVIPQGDPILAAYAAAGRDPERHGADADSFELRRADREHLAFGHGVHFCLGAPLARMEARTALPALLDRFPDLQLAASPDTLQATGSFIGNGVQSLPVRLNAR